MEEQAIKQKIKALSQLRHSLCQLIVDEGPHHLSDQSALTLKDLERHMMLAETKNVAKLGAPLSKVEKYDREHQLIDDFVSELDTKKREFERKNLSDLLDKCSKLQQVLVQHRDSQSQSVSSKGHRVREKADLQKRQRS